MPWIGPVVGGLIAGGSSLAAANKQGKGAGQANQILDRQYNQTRDDLGSYRNVGNNATFTLEQLLGIGNPMPTRSSAEATARKNLLAKYGSGYDNGVGDLPGYIDQIYQGQLNDWNQQNPNGQPQGALLKPFGMEDFQESPAYQFNLDQGMQAIGKASAARGKYYAPATLQDIGKYSQGLASNEFQNAFNNYNTGQNNIYSRLMGLSNQGENAAAQTGAAGSNAAGQMGQNVTGAANANAAGIVGAGNAVNGGISSAYNNYLLSQVLGQNQKPTYGMSGSYSNAG